MAAAPTNLTPFQATYHWRNKNCYPWSAEWFKQELAGLSAEKDDKKVEITEVTEVEGDVDLGQRKGKLLTIYDCRVVMKWKGTDGEDEVTGTVTVPEVSHECIDGISDYTFEWSSTSSAFRSFLQSALQPILIQKFNEFPKILVATHGNDMASSESGTATPVATKYSPAPPGEVRAKAAETKAASSNVVNTSTVTVEARLQASAEDMYMFLSDEKRIPMWSRSAAKMTPTPGAPFELFGGNVTGKVVSAEPGKKLVQSWQLKTPTWPSDHFGTMTITFDQGEDSTLTVFSLSGVPKGQESTLENAIDTYYIRGLKQMGLVLLSSATRPVTFQSTTTDSQRRSTGKTNVASKKLKKRVPKSAKNAASTAAWTDYLGYATIAASAIGLAGIVWSSYQQK
ncbi:Co-chaperone [Naganishia albida]|nr:Co-chaperone [Naganishia albida]